MNKALVLALMALMLIASTATPLRWEYVVVLVDIPTGEVTLVTSDYAVPDTTGLHELFDALDASEGVRGIDYLAGMGIAGYEMVGTEVVGTNFFYHFKRRY